MRDTAIMVLVFLASASLALAGEGGALPQDWSGELTRFILQLGVLVFVAKTGGRLFQRWKMPRVIGEIAAGVLVGPSLLGGLSLPFSPDGLMFDAAAVFRAQEPMCGVLTISLVIFFFLAGLNADVRQLRYSTMGGTAAGLGGFALCFMAALAVLGAIPALADDPAWGWTSPLSMLVCTAVSVASVNMLAQVLATRQRIESPAGTVALGAALVDNMAGLFLFTIFSGAYAAVEHGAAPDWYLLASMTGRTLLGLGGVALCGIPVARYVNNLALREKTYTGAFAASAACLLIAGGVMGVLGLSVMSGAYVMGLVFSTTDLRHEIRERLDFISVIMLPVCFAALGMQADLRLLGEPPVLLGSVLFVAAAAAAKAAGCMMPAMLTGLGGRGCLRVGAMSLPRGELTLALLAAVAGMAALPPGVVLGCLLLVVATSLCSPWLVKPLFDVGDDDARKPFAGAAPVRLVFQFPSHQAALLMINRMVEIFEDDGFYAHCLNRYQALYRISRGMQVIHLGCLEGDVIFECSERERPLVNAAMMELSSGVEQSLRELQRPLEEMMLRNSMQQPVAASVVASNMLRNRFAAEALKPRLLATTKQGAISELVSLLYENGLVVDRERAVQAVFEREQGMSTGLEFGLAIPHARTDAVARLVCAVGLKKEGLDFDAADGKPTRIVVLVLAPDNAASPQLQLIAQVCRQLDEQGRAALLACETPEDMLAVLTGGTAAQGNVPSKGALATVLQWQSVTLDLVSDDQAQAVALLLALCARSGAVGSVEEVRKALHEHGPLTAERIGEDAALFAVETPGVLRTVAALGVSARGVPCEGDGRRRVCVLLLYPHSAADNITHVKESFANALNTDGIAALLASKNSQEALAILAC